MDIDGFISTHEPTWKRLQALSTKGRKSVRSLDAGELDELVDLYQRVSAQLSLVRTQFDDPALTSRLSAVVGNAQGLIYRERGKPVDAIATFLRETFPAAAWTCRRSIGVAGVILLLPALIMGVWLNANGEARNVAVDETTQELIATQDFENYYKSKPASAWAFQLWTHNIRVAVIAYGGGALAGVGAVAILSQTSLNLGAMGAVMHANDKGSLFWGLIIPHGLLELSAIILAAGAGLRIGWAMIAPGARSRATALADEGQRSIVIVLGMMILLVISGGIEAFVTPSSLPTWARIAIGVAAETALVLWIVGLGRSATERGLTGKFGETEVPDDDPRSTDVEGTTDITGTAELSLRP